MPCNSDHMAASGQELESKRVCKLLVYLYSRLSKSLPDWILEAADDYYGNVARLDEATAMLCACCRSMSPLERKEHIERKKHIYNSHDESARKLANWWTRHQEWDERRVKEEKVGRRKIIARERALRKLTTEEMEALGLT